MLLIQGAANFGGMNAPKRQPPSDEHRREAAALHALWRSSKPRLKEAGVHTQAEIGERFGIGQQSTVAAYLTGKAALGLKAAQGFALAFNCKVADFSPRLAAELEAIRVSAARTEGGLPLDIGPEGQMLARAFEAVPDHTPELAAKRDILLGNLLALIDVARHGSAGTPPPAQPALPTQAPAALSRTQP